MDERRNERSETRRSEDGHGRTSAQGPIEREEARGAERTEHSELGSRGDGQKSSEELEREIARTRQEMDETVNELQRRMRPSHLRQQAQHVVKDTVRTSASEAGNRMLETVRDNPIPSIIAGLSIGWLVSAGNRSKSSPRTGPSGYYDHERGAGSRPAAGQDSDTWPAAGERAREAADEVQKTTEQYRQQMQQSVQQTAGEAQRRTQETIGDVRQSTRRTVGRVEQAVENNPLAAGVATLALGAFAGLMFPSTRQEDELVGDTRDRMVHQAQETARETADRARHVAEKTAEEAKRTAKEEVQQQQEEMSQKS